MEREWAEIKQHRRGKHCRKKKNSGMGAYKRQSRNCMIKRENRGSNGRTDTICVWWRDRNQGFQFVAWRLVQGGKLVRKSMSGARWARDAQEWAHTHKYTTQHTHFPLTKRSEGDTEVWVCAQHGPNEAQQEYLCTLFYTHLHTPTHADWHMCELVKKTLQRLILIFTTSEFSTTYSFAAISARLV